jgi:lysyl-tRNA synthetase class 2
MSPDHRPKRAALIRAVRDFFHNRDFIEADTPTLVLSPGMEPHIRPLTVEGRRSYLPTSPEFALKKLLAQGYPRLFQVCRAYRLEPLSSTHNPEFAILEWYRAGSGWEEIMDDVEELFGAIGRALGSNADVARPWPRLSVEECFRQFAGRDLVAMLPAEGTSDLDRERFNDEFFKIFMDEVEPGLKALNRPVIVHSYPWFQAALSNLYTDARGLRWAKRFEVYAGGLELGNAFDELTDAAEQRRRFEKDMALRQKLYGASFPASPLDEDFLSAVAKMPPAGGIAMGIDRMVMYFTGAASIDEVLWLPSYWPDNHGSEV